jgi:hypothetical protein
MRALLLAAVVALAASLATAATGAPPADVSLQIHPTSFCCPNETGSWDVSGAIADSGPFVRTEATSSPPNASFGALTPFREVFVLTGSLGTLTIRDQSRNTADGVVGVWEVVSGTDAYANASGHGTLTFFVSPGPIYTLSLTGVMSKTG